MVDVKADTSFEHRMNILGKIYLLIANTIWLVGKKESTCMFLFDTFLYFNMKLIFPMLFFIYVITLASPWKILHGCFEFQSYTTTDFLSGHFYMNVIIGKLKKSGSHFTPV